MYGKSKIIPISYQNVNRRRDIPYEHELTEQEIVVSLFTDCNIRCSFCADRDRPLSKPTAQLFEQRIRQLREVLTMSRSPVVALKVFGGELFQDKYDDSIFALYDQWMTKATKIIESQGRSWTIHFSSNLLFRKFERVASFLNKWGSVRGSFDLEGRFSKPWMPELYVENMDRLHEQGIGVSTATVMTKQNMRNIMHHGPNFGPWLQLYEKYPMHFDYYDDWDFIPHECGSEKTEPQDAKPTEREVADFLLFLYKNYPKTLNIQSLLSDKRSYHCSHGFVVGERVSYECCALDLVFSQFLKNKRCFCCPHFQRCGFTCTRIFADGDFCHIRYFYDNL